MDRFEFGAACAPPTPSSSVDLESASAVSAPDDPALRALLGALMRAGDGAVASGWRQADGCAEIVQRVGLDPIRVRFEGVDGVRAWRDVFAVTPLALDVLAVLVARFHAEGGEVRLVKSAEILAAKGCRRFGEERHALEVQVGRELMRLGRLRVGADDQPLFAVAPLSEGGASFVVTLSPAARRAWDRAPARRLNPALLRFDHRMNRGADVLAKKLGLYFSLAGSGSRPVVRSVRTVLTAIGAAQELSSGARGGRIADRFEEAALRLQERGVFTIAYRGEREPLCGDARAKGWVRRWLDAELVARPLA